MGIRTVGFQKSSPSSRETKKEQLKDAVKQEESVTTAEEVSNDKGLPAPKDADLPKEESAVERSPSKFRTPSAMARLGGIKVAARKIKKHRKRSLFVNSASKILRTSIRSNKNRRATNNSRVEEKRGSTTPPSRISTRTLVRRNSRDGIMDVPLRTVELIKRPLELREPATKLLYMASLGLYPRTGESDMTPIVVIKELSGSPGKKNGGRKSMELPLIPFHRRYIDLANQDKQSFSENVKPLGKKTKRERRKPSPVTNKSVVNDVKPVVKKSSSPSPVPSVVSSSASSVTDHQNMNEIKCKSSKKKSPPRSLTSSFASNNNISNFVTTSSETVPYMAAKNLSNKPVNSLLKEVGMSSSLKPKSLLRNNLTPSFKHVKEDFPSHASINLANFLPSQSEIPKPLSSNDILTSTYSGITNAMNLIMSNVTITPKNSLTSRKRSASPKISELQYSQANNVHIEAINNYRNIHDDYIKPPKKKQKKSSGASNKNSTLTLPMSVSINNNGFSFPHNLLLQPLTSQNTEDCEVLNLSVKNKPSEIHAEVAFHNKSPPKLLSGSDPAGSMEQRKLNLGCTNALNLIIPRPPPLTKAPLEITNIANCSTNGKPNGNLKPKKPRKSRKNLNNLNMQLQQMLPPMSVLPAETAVHAKSLLRCMNGEENSCVREIGESLDSVKGMLARLQTSIGPAVNGVRLITIE